MIVLDTDVLSDVLMERPDCIAKLHAAVAEGHCIPIVAAEEVLRGCLNRIRKLETNRQLAKLSYAYEMLLKTLDDLSRFQLVGYSERAARQFVTWRAAKINIGTHDLRIAAIAQTEGMRVATRNRKDFSQVPGLQFEIWP